MEHIIYLYPFTELVSELKSDLRDTVDWGREWLVDFNAGKAQFVLLDQFNSIGSIDMKIERSKLYWGSYIISIAKTSSNKIGALICSMQFLSLEFVLYLCKPTIRSCMEHCCHARLVYLVANWKCCISYKTGM